MSTVGRGVLDKKVLPEVSISANLEWAGGGGVRLHLDPGFRRPDMWEFGNLG